MNFKKTLSVVALASVFMQALVTIKNRKLSLHRQNQPKRQYKKLRIGIMSGPEHQVAEISGKSG